MRQPGPVIVEMPPLRLPATLSSLDEVARFVLAVAEKAGLSRADSYRLRLAADELATNIVMHGYRGQEGELRLEAGIEPDAVWVRLEDDARPFDPRTGCRPPDLKAPMAQRPIGGLGVYLALTVLDGFDYELADGRNRSTLLIHRHPEGC